MRSVTGYVAVGGLGKKNANDGEISSIVDVNLGDGEGHRLCRFSSLLLVHTLPL